MLADFGDRFAVNAWLRASFRSVLAAVFDVLHQFSRKSCSTGLSSTADIVPRRLAALPESATSVSNAKGASRGG
jgi:hypothetical protein